MKDPITLKSGKLFTPDLAPFEDGVDLYQTIARELLAVNFDISDLNADAIAAKDINTLKNAGLQIIQSKSVAAILNRCLLRCLYEGKKVVPADTFKDEDARGDYFPILWEVLKVNLLPFFKSLDLSFLTSAWLNLRNPASKAASDLPVSAQSA